MAKKKKTFQFVGIGALTKTNPSIIPVTYILNDLITVTVYVWGLHPSQVYDRDTDDCELIQDPLMAADAVDAVKAIWEWVESERNVAVWNHFEHLSVAHHQAMAADGK